MRIRSSFPARFARCATGCSITALASLALAGAGSAQVTLQDYQRAERFLPDRVQTLVFSADVQPVWIRGKDQFWYRNGIPAGEEFVRFDVKSGRREPAFDHARLAEGLGRALGRTVSPSDFPFDSFELDPAGDTISFRVREDTWRCSLASYGCVRGEVRQDRGGRSPDGKWEAFVRDHDLYLREVATGAERRLTHDGEPEHGYATPLPSPLQMIRERTEAVEQRPAVFWSPDSRRLLSYRIDARKAGRLTVVQHAPEHQMRPTSYRYFYPLPQDSVLPTAEPVLFRVPDGERIPVRMSPIQMQYYGGTGFRWSEDGRHAYATVADRGYDRQQVRAIDAETGEVRVVVDEVGNPFVDTSRGTIFREVDQGKKVLWGSERDGFMHLYLLDGRTGQPIRQLTRGPWVVNAIEHLDEKRGVVFFTARGREPRRDPYLLHLYRVNLDGTGLRLLTPEPSEHEVSFSPSGEYFVDTHSRVDQPPVTVLRRASDGAVLHQLEKANVQRLLATGWRFPEPFRAKARDGETDIYGVIWRPSNFDPARKYPVVEQIYTGPHSFFVPKSFAAFRNTAQSIAELGFVVVQVDGLGTAGRGKEFHRHSYRNLGDSGFEDHIGALRQLAERYPYMDLSRVGIYGHSAGGYNAARAVLAHPDFYKVSVASAGNHDHQLDKAWWNTQWMGYPVGEHYEQQSNLKLAPNLKGKLLLVHGDIDENVPVSATLRMADALIRADKDFDLLIMPNQTHALGRHPYFIRRRWDYFVQHLHGAEPPADFRLREQPN